MRRSLFFPVSLLAICSFPGLSSGSVLPSSANFNWGYTQDLGPHGTNLTIIPSVSATWQVSSRLAIRSSVTYLRERTVDQNQRGLTAGGTTRSFLGETRTINQTDFLPLATGLRFYAGGDVERTRGLFLDAAPAAFLARSPDGTGGHFFKAPLGFELGVGARFAGFDKSRFEVGLNYYHSLAVGGSGATLRPLERSPAESALSGLSLFSIYLGVGLGD
jgi:hypothetical protein